MLLLFLFGGLCAVVLNTLIGTWNTPHVPAAMNIGIMVASVIAYILWSAARAIGTWEATHSWAGVSTSVADVLASTVAVTCVIGGYVLFGTLWLAVPAAVAMYAVTYKLFTASSRLERLL